MHKAFKIVSLNWSHHKTLRFCLPTILCNTPAKLFKKTPLWDKYKTVTVCTTSALSVIHQNTRLSSLHFKWIHAETDLRSAVVCEGENVVFWLCYIGVQALPDLTYLLNQPWANFVKQGGRITLRKTTWLEFRLCHIDLICIIVLI